MKEEAPTYLINLIPKCESTIIIRSSSMPTLIVEQIISSTLFFPFTLSHWLKLDLNIGNSESISLFKSKLLSFIRPDQRKIYNFFDPKGLKFLTCLRLGLNELQPS